MVKNPPANVGDARDVGLIPCQEDPMEEKMATYSIFLSVKSHGLRSFAGYSPWGRKESDKSEVTEHAFIYLGCAAF